MKQFEMTVSVGLDDERPIDKRRPFNPHEAGLETGHIVGSELMDGNATCISIIYLYDSIEGCIAMIIREGFYRFERPAPKGRNGLWTDMARRIRANIEADVAYA